MAADVTWPKVNDRVVLSGRVDEVAASGGAVYVDLDDAQCITSPIRSRALVRVHHYVPVPELTPHVLLRSQWLNGADRDQVMVIGAIVGSSHGLVQVEFSQTYPRPITRVTFDHEKLIFGRTNDG